MIELPKAPVSGDNVLEAFLRLRHYVRRTRLLSVSGGKLKQTDNGCTLEMLNQFREFASMFDMTDRGETTFKIKSNGARDYGAMIGNALVTVGVGANMTWNGTDDKWESGTLTGAVYVFLKGTISTGAIVIDYASAFPTPDSDTIYQPLWQVLWDGDNSRIDGRVDMRHAYSLGASSGGTINAAWYASKSGDLEISIAHGDIESAPQDVIAWGDITDAAETITIPSGETEWHIWVEVDVVNLSATMFSANTIDALDSTEERTKLIKRIADVTISADVITAIQACQCGNIHIVAK